MNIVEFVLRHGGKIINHYKVDGKDVNEITYKKTEKVKEDVKKEAFLGNVHVTHKAMTQKGLEYKKNCVQKVQKKIDEYIEDGSKFSHELLGHLLLDLGEIKKRKKVDIVGRVFTIEYNDTQYVVSFKFDGEAKRDMHVEKI